MTALTAGFALLLPALGGGEPGNELQTPMAIVILGGLLSATVLNMLVLPALYRLYGVPADGGVRPGVIDVAHAPVAPGLVSRGS